MKYFQKTKERVQQGWTIIFIGEVKLVHRTNIDKSGRKPKYIVQIQMIVDSIDDAAKINLRSPISCQARETKVISYLGRLPKIGERLEIMSYGLDERPQQLSIDGAKFISSI